MKELNTTTKEYMKRCGKYNINIDHDFKLFTENKIGEEDFQNRLVKKLD